jgi:hypothetical protein
MALAELGNSSPEIIAALHRHFASSDSLHAALSALAAWRLKPADANAADAVRQSLNRNDYDSYVLLEDLGRRGSSATPFYPEIHKLIENSQSADYWQTGTAALAEWRLFQSPDQSIKLINKLVASASQLNAPSKEVEEFATTALDLKDVPEVRSIAIPKLAELKAHPDKHTADFCAEILKRLEVIENH